MTEGGSEPRDLGVLIADRYQLEQRLGEGGSGTVYVARVIATDESASSIEGPRPTVGQRVALKLLHLHLARDVQVVRRFAREARILRKLRGDHLVSLLDSGQTSDGQLFLALELVEGPSLNELAVGGPLAASRAIHLLLQVCSALEQAHALGVVHRDLKPLNVLVEQRGAEDYVRVLDFGMAKITRGELSESVNALTQQNMVFGTPEYMAPEQARGEEVDERVDVYAAGVMLYELLTGTVPFQATTPIATMTAHLLQEPEPPTRRAPRAAIPPALESIVLHALAKQPAHRYPSARSLAEALESARARPSDVSSVVPPPRAHADLGTRDTELALHMTASLRRTELSLEPARLPEPPRAASGLSFGWIVVALAAGLVGVALGIVMSLVSAR